MSDYAINLRANFLALGFVSFSMLMSLYPNFFRECIEFWGCANQFRGALDERMKLRIFLCQARNRKLVDGEKVQVIRNFHSDEPIERERIE